MPRGEGGAGKRRAGEGRRAAARRGRPGRGGPAAARTRGRSGVPPSRSLCGRRGRGRGRKVARGGGGRRVVPRDGLPAGDARRGRRADVASAVSSPGIPEPPPRRAARLERAAERCRGDGADASGGDGSIPPRRLRGPGTPRERPRIAGRGNVAASLSLSARKLVPWPRPRVPWTRPRPRPRPPWTPFALGHGHVRRGHDLGQGLVCRSRDLGRGLVRRGRDPLRHIERCRAAVVFGDGISDEMAGRRLSLAVRGHGCSTCCFASHIFFRKS